MFLSVSFNMANNTTIRTTTSTVSTTTSPSILNIIMPVGISAAIVLCCMVCCAGVLCKKKCKEASKGFVYPTSTETQVQSVSRTATWVGSRPTPRTTNQTSAGQFHGQDSSCDSLHSALFWPTLNAVSMLRQITNLSSESNHPQNKLNRSNLISVRFRANFYAYISRLLSRNVGLEVLHTLRSRQVEQRIAAVIIST